MEKDFEYFWEEDKKKRKEAQKKVEPIVAGVIGVNVQQVGDTIVVKANMPGFSSNEIQFMIKDGVVRVSGNKEIKNIEKGKHFYREDYGSSEVSKQFSIPKDVDTKNIEAKKKNGFLEVLLKKKKKTKN
jgi:HSP20 family protein